MLKILLLPTILLVGISIYSSSGLIKKNKISTTSDKEYEAECLLLSKNFNLVIFHNQLHG